MMTVKYLKADLYRMFRAPNFYIAAVSIFVIYLISTLQNFGGTNVAEMFWVVKFYSLIICIFAGSSFAFANSLLEDEEHRFCYAAVLRGNCKAYVRAKVICCFVGAMLAVMAGTLLYAVLLRTWLPFYGLEDDAMTKLIREHDIFGSCIKDGGFVVYFLASGLVIGLLGGILSLVSMWLSLIAKNKMFAVCFPVIAYYFIVNYSADLLGQDAIWLNFNGIYLYSSYVFDDKPFFSFLYAVLLAVILSIGLGQLIYRRVCRIWR